VQILASTPAGWSFGNNTCRRRKAVSWEKVLRLLMVNRLLDQGSEFRGHRQWFADSAMDDRWRRTSQLPKAQIHAPRGAMRLRLPSHAVSQTGDMRGVMAAVPGVERQVGIETHQPQFGVAESAGVVGIG